VNIYDIAQACGVSVASISRVINGKEGVGEETRKMIQQKLDELGFVPKTTVSSFDTIAVIVTFDEQSNPFNSSYLYEVIKGLSDVIFQRKKTFSIFSMLNIPMQKDTFRVFCYKHQIGGVLFLALRPDQTFADEIASTLPVVALGNPCGTFHNITFVSADNFNGASELTRYMIAMGHHHIIFAGPSLDLFEDHRQRFLGYKKALQDAGIPFNTRLLIEYDYTNYSDSDIGNILDRVLTDTTLAPTAIFCCDDQEVYRISKILRGLGYALPDRVSIVGFDDYELSAHFDPPLTTVKQPLIEQGRLAGRLLCDAIDKNADLVPESLVLPTRLVVRSSVRRIQ
jgi:DNA-binding LacI/PurR family transcriptional regulator